MYMENILFLRKHCQDLVSIETKEENTFIMNNMRQNNVKYIWTSGRKCNFDGCDRADLMPHIGELFLWYYDMSYWLRTRTTDRTPHR